MAEMSGQCLHARAHCHQLTMAVHVDSPMLGSAVVVRQNMRFDL